MGCKTFLLNIVGAGALAIVAGCATTAPEPDSTVSDQAQTTASQSTQSAPRGPVAGTQDDLNATAGNQVTFDYDRFDLRSDAQAALRRQAAWLRANPGSIVQIQGNCDERGTREYNLGLGNSRAESVKAFLVSQGIDGSRVRTISFGKERPVCSASTESCWARNRNATTVVQRSGS